MFVALFSSKVDIWHHHYYNHHRFTTNNQLVGKSKLCRKTCLWYPSGFNYYVNTKLLESVEGCCWVFTQSLEWNSKHFCSLHPAKSLKCLLSLWWDFSISISLDLVVSLSPYALTEYGGAALKRCEMKRKL